MAPSRSGCLYCSLQLLSLLLAALVPIGETVDNIDMLEPIVRLSPLRRNRGSPTNGNGAAAGPGDHFGYSATLHQVKVPSSFLEAVNSTRIVVGAPKATYPGGLPMNVLEGFSPENLTGLVYQCPVNPGECGPIGDGSLPVFDALPNKIVPRDLTDPFSNDISSNLTEVKSQQMMGATVVSSGDRLLACAPRFALSFDGIPSVLAVDSRKPIGRCFISSKNLTDFVEMRPCVPVSLVSGTSANRCLIGTTAVINKVENNSFVVLGAPGVANFHGAGYFYSVNETSVTSMFENPNLPGSRDLYDTYAMTTGNITGGPELNYITSLPRANGSDYRGLVVVRSSNFYDIVPLAPIRGSQLAEYFGWSLAVADLNGDGYDELIVGAPLYSSGIQEQGVVYVFKNNGGNISVEDPIVLTGDNATRARFGTSLVKLGDVNDDGYEDFAVGAPYQEVGTNGNTGKVFIYYGSEEKFVVNASNQTISAEDVVSTTGQGPLRSFGWSLSSGIDVDNNQYEDLLVGAYESGAAVLFRTLSIARIEVSVSSNLTDNRLLIDLRGGPVSFNLMVCASFSGRGLTGSLETTLNMSETMGSRRLLFDGFPEYSQPFDFSAANEQTCKNVTATIPDKRDLYTGGVTSVDDFQIEFSLSQEPRTTPPGFDGNPAVLTDFTTRPILIVNGDREITVSPLVLCGNGVCNPDLAVSITGQGYVYSSNTTKREFPDIVAGSSGVDLITVPLRIENKNIDAAVGATLEITIPIQFEFNSSSGANVPCTIVTVGGPRYNCVLPSFIGGRENLTFNLVWRRRASEEVSGAEADFTSTITAMIVNDMDLTNNVLMTTVEFGAVADLDVTITRWNGPPNYNYQAASSSLRGVEPVLLVVRLRNGGPSTLQNVMMPQGGIITNEASVIIRIPTQDELTGENYYLYPGSYSASMQENPTVECDSRDFNPDRRELPSDTSSRRKRSIRPRRQETAAQDSGSQTIPSDSLIKNCSASPESCRNEINCTIKDWRPNQAVALTIRLYLDSRFFFGRRDSFTFVAEARVSIQSSVVRDDNMQNNRIVANPYSVQYMEEPSDNNFILIIVPIVAVLAALILIFLIACLLYFCGFFRRKKYKKEEPEEVQVCELQPGETGTAVNGGKTAPPPGEEVNPDRETTPTKNPESLSDGIGGASDAEITTAEAAHQEGTPTKELEPKKDDIGDTFDLRDGEITKAEAEDPDETSL